MATKTWYATSNLVSVHQEMSETDPGTEAFASPTTGWVVGTTGTGTGAFQAQTESSTFSGTNPDGSINTSAPGDCLRSTNTYTGTFASGNWTVNFCVRSSTAVAANGRMLCRLFRSSNANGSSATEINAGTKTGSTVTLSTSTTLNSTVTFNPGSFSVTNEYIFIQLAWERTSAASMSTSDVNMRVGNSASLGTRVVSADFAPERKELLTTFTPVVYARTTLYPTIFEPPLGRVYAQGVAALAGSTTIAWVGSSVVTATPIIWPSTNVIVTYSKTVLYPTLFEPPPQVSTTVSGTLAIAGSTTIAWSGVTVRQGSFTIAGSTAIAWSGASNRATTLTIDLGTAVAWVGTGLGTSTWLVSGSTDVAWIGRAIGAGTLTIAGSTSVAWTGRATGQGTLTISGSTTAAFTGRALSATTLTIAGSTTIAWTGRSIAAGTLGVSLGTAVSWIGTFTASGTGLMLVSGSTTVSFIGRSLAAGTLGASGSTNIAWIGASRVAGAFAIASGTEISWIGAGLTTSSSNFAISGSSTLNWVGSDASPAESVFSIEGSTSIAWLGFGVTQILVPPLEGYESQVGVWHVHGRTRGKSGWRGRTGKRYRIWGYPPPEPPLPVGPLWILDDGYWHDLGIWIDTEFWED